MKIYCLIDITREEIINVFLSKNDNVAINTLKQEININKITIDLKLYCLDLSIDYENDRIYLFQEEGEEFDTRMIYSYPQSETIDKNNVIKEIIKEQNNEEEN